MNGIKRLKNEKDGWGGDERIRGGGIKITIILQSFRVV